ncbi:MAG TPA: hypothetical protein VHN77_15635 [Phycisphaerales bacterium]|nr:hypothetical protein [Phycisphaerales bacterium]
MADSSRRRNILIVIALICIAIIILLLTRCRQKPVTAPAPAPPVTPVAPKDPAPAQPSAAPPGAQLPEEVLTPATITAPPSVIAGQTFNVTWTGPNNPGDYVMIVPSAAPASVNGNYGETQHGPSLELTAPMEPGPFEVRYVTARSRTILARATIEVTAPTAALEAPATVPLGALFAVTWTGPDNKGDYITIVRKDAPDGTYANYTLTEKGSPLTITAPPEAGAAEVRYMTGQGSKVLARREVTIAAPDVTLDAPADAIAGTTIRVTWAGPNNSGDYITIVPKEFPDGRYGNYTNTSKGSPMDLLAPITAGDAELRYMTGQGAKVLARRAITISAASITLMADPECAPGAAVSVTWTGPNNPGDYITIVPKITPDEGYAAYANTDKGSPLSINAPKDAGDAEIRYVAGQGRVVLARVPIRVR